MSKCVFDAALENMWQFVPVHNSPGGCYCSISSSHAAFSPECAHFHYLAPHRVTQLFKIDLISVLSYKIHHIDCHDDRYSQFYKLSREIKIPLYICSIHDIEDCIRFFLYKIFTGNNFLQSIRAE